MPAGRGSVVAAWQVCMHWGKARVWDEVETAAYRGGLLPAV